MGQGWGCQARYSNDCNFEYLHSIVTANVPSAVTPRQSTGSGPWRLETSGRAKGPGDGLTAGRPAGLVVGPGERSGLENEAALRRRVVADRHADDHRLVERARPSGEERAC